MKLLELEPVPEKDEEENTCHPERSEGSQEGSEELEAGGGIPSVTAFGGDSSPLAKGEPLEGDGEENVCHPEHSEGSQENSGGLEAGGGIPSVTSLRTGASSPFAKGEPLEGDGAPSTEQIPDREGGTGEPAPYGDGEPLDGDFGGGAKRRFRIRAEWVMVGIAFLAAGVLGVTAAFSKLYFDADEDPMELPSYHMAATEPEETVPEPEEAEPKNPTIPPDRNPYDRFDFQYDRHNYLLLQNVESFPGVDVSAYQGDIDWERVAASGIRFAIVRLGYRGYGSGKLVEDEYAQANLDGAAEAGLQVGAYFFSQALNEQEVDQEIRFLLDVLGERELDMPVILDWEIPTADARTAGKMDARSLTDLQLYFCREMEERGYRPMVYFNWHQSEELYLLSELEKYPFWLALYQDRMTYPWKVEMWQYSCTGKVPGINGDVDLNVYMP